MTHDSVSVKRIVWAFNEELGCLTEAHQSIMTRVEKKERLGRKDRDKLQDLVRETKQALYIFGILTQECFGLELDLLVGGLRIKYQEFIKKMEETE